MRIGVLLVLGVVVGAGCAASPKSKPQPEAAPLSDANTISDAAFDELDAELSQKQVSVADPLEPVNRVMYSFNDVLFVWIIKPIMQVYTDVVPKPARTGIRSFFHNLTTPIRLANCLLQGKGAEAGTEVNRFAINTTVGALGVGDPARDRWGLKPAEEDLGQTLAVYGFGDGFYIVWPLLGSSTLRDSVGMVGDEFLNPVRYIEPSEVSVGLSVTNGVNGASFYLGDYESMKAATVDPYVALREAYLQYRQGQIRDDVLPYSSDSPK